MVYQTFIQYMNSTGETGILSILLYANFIWAGTTPLILFALFSIVMGGIYLGQKAGTGEGNPLIAFATAMTFVMFISAIMSLKSGLINVYTLGIVFILWMISIVGLILSKDRF